MADWGLVETPANASASVGWNYFMSGISDDVADMKLQSMKIKITNLGVTARLALFAGGVVGDMTTAVLIEDLGTGVTSGTDVDGYLVIPSTTNPDIPQNSRLWVGMKTNSAWGKNGAAPIDDITEVRRYFNSSDLDPLVPFTSSPPSNGDAYTSRVWAVSLNYEIAPSGPTLASPDSVTEATQATVTGTELTSFGTFSLQTSDEGSTIVQDSWLASSDVEGTFTPESGANLCTIGNPVAGVPMQPTLSAVGVTIEQIQMKGST